MDTLAADNKLVVDLENMFDEIVSLLQMIIG